MVHLQDRTRYVSNPDGILSAAAVTAMDTTLFALEQKTGIQTVVVAVRQIEGGDCFDFAYQLGEKNGVGQKGKDNGLVILLVTEERCIQFATGYGLEGILPDAICKRIQTRYMNPYLSKGDWDSGMVAGIQAVRQVLDKSSGAPTPPEGESDGLLILSSWDAALSLYLPYYGILHANGTNVRIATSIPCNRFRFVPFTCRQRTYRRNHLSVQQLRTRTSHSPKSR